MKGGFGVEQLRQEVEALRQQNERLMILFEALINYMRAAALIDIDDFNTFLQDNQITNEPMFRPMDKG